MFSGSVFAVRCLSPAASPPGYNGVRNAADQRLLCRRGGVDVQVNTVTGEP
jgi:hypothetical protein